MGLKGSAGALSAASTKPKRCCVACDTAAGILTCEVELAPDATIEAALAVARGLLGESAADWEQAPAGIYGEPRPRTHVPADGDRIELYRPLKADPRASRRSRARQSAAAGKRAGPGNGPRGA